MTRSEAAKICQSIKFILENSDYTEAVEEALDMAIAALDQEETLKNLKKPNKSDLISRQAAIDALYDKGLSMTAWGELLAMKWSDIQTCIELLPSADRPKGHWIDDDEQQILMKKFIEKGENWKVCNICGAGMRVGAKYDTDEQYHDFFHNYCPYCGARMESGEE